MCTRVVTDRMRKAPALGVGFLVIILFTFFVPIVPVSVIGYIGTIDCGSTTCPAIPYTYVVMGSLTYLFFRIGGVIVGGGYGVTI